MYNVVNFFYFISRVSVFYWNSSVLKISNNDYNGCRANAIIFRRLDRLLIVVPRNRAKISSQGSFVHYTSRDTYSGCGGGGDGALQTFAALMFSGFLFSLSLETDPPGLNVLSHETRRIRRHARQTRCRGYISRILKHCRVCGMPPTREVSDPRIETQGYGSRHLRKCAISWRIVYLRMIMRWKWRK